MLRTNPLKPKPSQSWHWRTRLFHQNCHHCPAVVKYMSLKCNQETTQVHSSLFISFFINGWMLKNTRFSLRDNGVLVRILALVAATPWNLGSTTHFSETVSVIRLKLAIWNNSCLNDRTPWRRIFPTWRDEQTFPASLTDNCLRSYEISWKVVPKGTCFWVLWA